MCWCFSNYYCRSLIGNSGAHPLTKNACGGKEWENIKRGDGKGSQSESTAGGK